jgi:hypothetical protein
MLAQSLRKPHAVALRLGEITGFEPMGMAPNGVDSFICLCTGWS